MVGFHYADFLLNVSRGAAARCREIFLQRPCFRYFLDSFTLAAHARLAAIWWTAA